MGVRWEAVHKATSPGALGGLALAPAKAPTAVVAAASLPRLRSLPYLALKKLTPPRLRRQPPDLSLAYGRTGERPATGDDKYDGCHGT
jgi:hypothetical protein